MTERKSDHVSSCPSGETLSAWYDGEAVLSAEVEQHVRTCPLCQEKLCGFNTMTRRLHAFGDSINSAGLADRIQTGARKLLVPCAEPGKRRFNRRWKIRFLLLLAAAALFVWLFFFRDPPGKTARSPQPAAAARNPFYVEAEIRAPSAAGPRKHQAYSISCATTVSGHPFELLVPPSFCVLDTGYPCRFLPPVFLRSPIRQFWLSPSFPASVLRGFLEEMLRRFETASPAFTAAPGMLTLDLETDARLTVLLVKQLKSWGLQLLDPAPAPRPEQNLFHGAGTERIRSRFIFLTIPEDSGILPRLD